MAAATVVSVVVVVMVVIRVMVVIVIMTVIAIVIMIAATAIAAVFTAMVIVMVPPVMIEAAVVIRVDPVLGIQTCQEQTLRVPKTADGRNCCVVRDSGHRHQMDGKHATNHAADDPHAALDSCLAARASLNHVSFSALDTVCTRDGLIDGGMLRSGLHTAAVERSRVNFPEDSGASVHQDKHETRVAMLDRWRRFLTRDVLRRGNIHSKWI
jgi:hypothetical protein